MAEGQNERGARSAGEAEHRSRLGRCVAVGGAEVGLCGGGSGAAEHQHSTRERPDGSERAKERGEAPDAGF